MVRIAVAISFGLVLALLFAHLTIRAFVETGEERFWLMSYLLVMAIGSASIGYFLCAKLNLGVRLLLSIALLVVVPTAAYSIPRFADAIAEGRMARWLYGPLVAGEALYLRLFEYEDHYRVSHGIRVENVQLVKALNSCDLGKIDEAIAILARTKSGGDDTFREMFIDDYLQRRPCLKQAEDRVRSVWRRQGMTGSERSSR